MNKKEYTCYSKELESNGYEFMKDQPYDGRNLWVKFFKDKSELITIHVYKRIDELDREIYTLKPYGHIASEDSGCVAETTISFNTMDIAVMENIFNKYKKKLTQS